MYYLVSLARLRELIHPLPLLSLTLTLTLSPGKPRQDPGDAKTAAEADDGVRAGYSEIRGHASQTKWAGVAVSK